MERTYENLVMACVKQIISEENKWSWFNDFKIVKESWYSDFVKVTYTGRYDTKYLALFRVDLMDGITLLGVDIDYCDGRLWYSLETDEVWNLDDMKKAYSERDMEDEFNQDCDFEHWIECVLTKNNGIFDEI